MDVWLNSYSDLLADRLTGDGPMARLGSDQQEPVLDLARIVAHGTERKNAPLAAFIAGRYCALREAEGVEPSAALAEAIDAARRLLGDIAQQG